VTIFDEYLLVNIDSTAEIPVTIRKRLLVISVNADKTCINVAETTVLSTQTPVLTTETPQRKEKEIKENEIKSSSPGPGWEAGRMTTKKIACVMELFPKGTKAAVARSMAESLSGWLEVFPPAVIGKAISISLNYNAFNLKYICNVLKDWQRQELHNIGDVERYLDNFKKGGNGGANAAANSERVKAKHGIMARDFNFADLEIMAMRDAEKRGGIVHNDQ
jgi:DnaD/phage-associated family protein